MSVSIDGLILKKAKNKYASGINPLQTENEMTFCPLVVIHPHGFLCNKVLVTKNDKPYEQAIMRR